MAPESLELASLAMLFLKVTAWCAVPFLLRQLLQGLSAANRHLLLTLTLAGCLAMPLTFAAGFTWAAPSWLQVAAAAEAPPRSLAAPSGLSLPTPSMPPSATAGMPLAGARRGADLRPAETARALPTASPPAPAPNAAPVEGSPLEKPSHSAIVSQLPWPLLGRWAAAGLLLLWCLGTAAALLRLAVHHRQARQLVAASTPVLDHRALESLKEACQRLGRDPRGELRESPASPVAFAWPNGWLPGSGRRPSAVVLPTSWREWDNERLTVVLVHEVAHLVRRDGLALWLGRAAVALWWFHPLVRSLESWARRECEQAADDAVLLSGSRASEYANHLISICRALARPFPVGVSLMLSDGPELKERLLAILRADQPRQVLSRRIAVAASLAVLAAALLVAGIRFAPPVEAGETPEETEPPQQIQEAQEARQAEQNGDWKIEAEDPEDGSDHSYGYSYRVASNQDTKKRTKRSRTRTSGDAGEDAYDSAYEAYREDRYDEAAAGFTAAAEAGYRPATATYNAACSLALADRRQEAISTLERAFELGFDDPEHYVEDSDLDRLRSDPRFQALVDHAFATAGRKRDVGRHYRYQRIQNELAALQDMGSQDADSWHRVGTALLQMRELDAAAEALGQAARLDKESPSTSLYNLACAFALDGRQREALEALEFAIHAGYDDAEHLRQDPDLTSLRKTAEFERLAQLAHDLDLDRFREAIWEKRHRKGKKEDGKYTEYSPAAWAPAIDFYRGFTAENPSLGVGWFNYGYALHYSRRHDEAASAFQKARELGYRPATSTYNVACAYSMMDRVEPALDALEEAIELGFDSGFDHDDDLDNLRGNLRFVKLHLQSKVARHFN